MTCRHCSMVKDLCSFVQVSRRTLWNFVNSSFLCPLFVQTDILKSLTYHLCWPTWNIQICFFRVFGEKIWWRQVTISWANVLQNAIWLQQGLPGTPSLWELIGRYSVFHLLSVLATVDWLQQTLLEICLLEHPTSASAILMASFLTKHGRTLFKYDLMDRDMSVLMVYKCLLGLSDSSTKSST